MPWHMHPTIRAIEEVRESAGNISTLDSGGVTEIKWEEGAGAKRTKQVPKIHIVYLGTTYTPS